MQNNVTIEEKDTGNTSEEDSSFEDDFKETIPRHERFYYEALDVLSNFLERVDYKDMAEKDVLLFLGPTGSGKSTLINYLLNRKLKFILKPSPSIPIRNENVYIKLDDNSSVSDNNNGILNYDKHTTPTPPVGTDWDTKDNNSTGSTTDTGGDDEEDYVLSNDGNPPVIGHTYNSQTLYVTPFKALGNKNLYYCDCAGFFENRGVKERFVAMISRNTIIKSCRRVRGIVFVCEYNSLTVDRGRSFIEGVLQVLRDLLSIDSVTLNKSDKGIDWSPFESIFFCFSKVPDRVNKRKIVKGLEELERDKKQSSQYQSMCLAKILEYRNIFIIRPVNKETNKLNSKSKTKAKLLKKINADKYLPKNILKFLGDAGEAEMFKTIVSFLINKTAIAFHELKEIPKMRAKFEGMIDEVNRSIITNEEAIKSLENAEKEEKAEYEKRKEEIKEQRQKHTRIYAVQSIIQEKEKEKYKINLDILDLTNIKLWALKISKKNLSVNTQYTIDYISKIEDHLRSIKGLDLDGLRVVALENWFCSHGIWSSVGTVFSLGIKPGSKIILEMKSPCTYSNIEGKPWTKDVAGKTIEGSIKKIAIGIGYGFKLKYQTPRFGHGSCILHANVKKRNIPHVQNRLKTQEDYINFYINYIYRIIQETETIEEETEIVSEQIKTKDKENLSEGVQLNEEKIEEIKTITNKEALEEKTTGKENLSEVVESKEEEIAFVRFRLRPIMIDIFKKCFENFLLKYPDDNQIISADHVKIKSYLSDSIGRYMRSFKDVTRVIKSIFFHWATSKDSHLNDSELIKMHRSFLKKMRRSCLEKLDMAFLTTKLVKEIRDNLHKNMKFIELRLDLSIEKVKDNITNKRLELSKLQDDISIYSSIKKPIGDSSDDNKVNITKKQKQIERIMNKRIEEIKDDVYIINDIHEQSYNSIIANMGRSRKVFASQLKNHKTNLKYAQDNLDEIMRKQLKMNSLLYKFKRYIEAVIKIQKVLNIDIPEFEVFVSGYKKWIKENLYFKEV